MATFSAQIQDLVGTFSDETAMDQWLEDGVRELVNIFPGGLKEMCYSKNTFTSAAAGSEAETIASNHLGNIFAGSVECRRIDSVDKFKAEDSSHVDKASATDPVYYVEGGKLNILPSSSSGIYYLIADPSIDASADSAISNFPNEAEYLVILYASTKALQQKMNVKKGDLPSDPVTPVLETISETLPTWSAPSDLVVPVKPTVPNLSVQTIDSFGTAPTYSKPTITTRVAFSSYTSGLSETDPGILTVTSVSPATPSLSTTSVSFSQTAPAFTKPVVAPDFAQVNTYIDTDEDIELASSKLQEISAQLNEYSANIQNEQTEFNKENAEYQAQLQISIQNAQFDNQEDARKIQKYQAEVTTYQANVNKEVQQYSQKLSHYSTELNTAYQAWSQTESNSLQQYTTDIQNELNEFNKENVPYQATIQEKIQEAQLADSNEARKLQKYQAEVGTYSAELNANVQKFTQEVTKNRAAFDTSLQKYSSEIQKVSAANQSILSKYTGEVGSFTQIIQKQTVDYQWLQAQYAQLKADYQLGIQSLIGGGGSPSPPAG